MKKEYVCLKCGHITFINNDQELCKCPCCESYRWAEVSPIESKPIKHSCMNFLDCDDNTIINLEHIVFIDTIERSVEFTNGSKIYYNPELFENIMIKIRKHMI